jgi:hypothetical protein
VRQVKGRGSSQVAFQQAERAVAKRLAEINAQIRQQLLQSRHGLDKRRSNNGDARKPAAQQLREHVVPEESGRPGDEGARL